MPARRNLTWLHFWKAAQDLDSPLTSLYLWELNVDPTRAELEANVALYEALRTWHPNAPTRPDATMAEAFALREMGRLAEATALSRSLGFIQDWAILGAFDNEDGKGFLTTLAPRVAAGRADLRRGAAAISARDAGPGSSRSTPTATRPTSAQPFRARL